MFLLNAESLATRQWKESLRSVGASIISKAVTETLYVSPNGTGADGKTWATAYQTIQDALNVASTDTNDCTLILISPHVTNYDINTTGDPTWTGNYILKGSHRTWAKIKNTHGSATSIMKFTGKVMLCDLNINLGTATNGIILTHGGWRVCHCQFIGEDLTQAANAVEISNGIIKHGEIEGCYFDGHVSYMTAIKLNNAYHDHIKHCHITACLKGVWITGNDSDGNVFKEIDFDDNALALDLDAGNRNHFTMINFDGNTENIDDEVGDGIWENISGEFPICICPQDLTGVTVTAHNDANTWGSNAEIRPAADATTPFRIVGYVFEPLVEQKHLIRFSADGGSTYFDELLVRSKKETVGDAPSGTEFIFNRGTQIIASCKAETGGEDTIQIWLKTQGI